MQDLQSTVMKLASQLIEARAECGRLKLEEVKMVGFKDRLSTLESECVGLEAEKSRLVAQEI